MHVLLSIRPNHVRNILLGTKKFEFRRKVPKRSEIKTALIYCTRPVGMLVAEFDIEDVLTADPDNLWKETRHGSGITRSFFDEYFKGRAAAYAIKIGEVRAF